MNYNDMAHMADQERKREREEGMEPTKENDIMGALLERYQAGIQMSGDSTHWQKHLDDIDEQFLREGEDGQLSNAGHDLSDMREMKGGE